jgi:hypothetical protein
MPRGLNKLSPAKVAALIRQGIRMAHPDGGGLYLDIKGPNVASWIFRYMLEGRDHWMGLAGC